MVMITVNRDLYSGTPVWKDEKQPKVLHQPLNRDISTDILIIGAGVSAALMAEALSENQNLDIVMVDRRPPLEGSTAATTALIQYEIDEPYIKLAAKIGEKKAAAAWRRSKLGLESLGIKIRQLGIDCSFERRNSLYLSGNVLNPAKLREEGQARNAIGLHGDYMGRAELKRRYGIHAPAGLLCWDNIACNPIQMSAGFLNAAINRGVKIFSPVDVENLKRKSGGGYIALTSEGYSIRAEIVILLTGYEIPRHVPHKKHTIHSTWALSTKPVKGIPSDFPFMWQAATPYFYGRTTADGRFIFGGEDEEFADAAKRDSLIPRKIAKLEKTLKKILPDYTFETEHRWAGSFGSSTTGLPSMGRVPGYKGLYAVMAYGGNGITFSRIAAEIIAADIFGYRDPDAALFSFRS
jgi:glycine/D-amino acid oxidase-like deaminating enzyme